MAASKERESSGPALAGLLLPIVAGVIGTIVLWRTSLEEQWRLLTLFAIAGALGGFVRSSAYGIASKNFTRRELLQWKTEAYVSPVVGAGAGLLAYFAVDALLVVGEIERAGQYIVSFAAGAFALSFVGRFVERGLVRSTFSKSGILGGEPSPSLPMLDRFDQLLHERVIELTTVNYSGSVSLRAVRAAPRNWVVEAQFYPQDLGKHPEEKAADAEGGRSTVTPIQVLGGADRPYVPFTLSVTSEQHYSVPAVLSVTVPLDAVSAPSQLVVEQSPTTETPAPGVTSSVQLLAVELGQAGATVQVMTVELP